MRAHRFVASVCAFALLLAAPLAQAGVGKGDLEAGVSLSIANTKITPDAGASFETDTGYIGGNIGYFFTDIFEAKAALSAVISSFTDPSTGTTTKTTTGIFAPGVDAVFLGSRKVAPFVGVGYGLSFGDKPAGSPDSDFYEGHAGLKFFIKERASLEAKVTKFEPTDSAAKTGRLEIAVGLNIYF